MLQHHSWQKSSFCGSGDSCVHIAATATGTTQIHLTESSDPRRAILGATPRAFGALIHVLKENARRG
ncbi:DUF397 domain-containing protein [Streptomyces sp. NPDC048275]|uniref:DUF397 domain-containing protein n=1 Tax=Streptomyces sp. NPDC048275 TaxID=3155629 RepID=UPI003408FE45